MTYATDKPCLDVVERWETSEATERKMKEDNADEVGEMKAAHGWEAVELV